MHITLGGFTPSPPKRLFVSRKELPFNEIAMAPGVGHDPTIFALTVRCDTNFATPEQNLLMGGSKRIELLFTEPQPVVLPLDELPHNSFNII